jgi:aminoglycoside phosphotransferase (APT) family kinase protein
MTGLLPYTRDPDVPRLAGDDSLSAPSEQEVLALAAEHLALDCAPEAATWTYARWKPGVSLTTAWTLRVADGGERWVVLKRYATEKAKELAKRKRGEGEAVLVEQGLHLWRFPFDRKLPGLPRALELHRTSRLIRELGFLFPYLVRWSSSSVHTLRYKPERRAVLRLDLSVRLGDKQGPKSAKHVAARIVPVEEARRIASARTAASHASFAGLLPRFCGAQERTGMLFEEWLGGRASAPDDFAHAERAGRALAALHVAIGRGGGAMRAPASAPEILPLLGAVPQVLAAARELRQPPVRNSTWTHGDFHPDQLLVDDTGATRLLDLDQLGEGDPYADLASWIADHLAADSGVGFDGAAGPLLEGYGRAVELQRLRAHTAWRLLLLAAGALRRLEAGAAEKAVKRVECARAVLAAPSAPGPVTPDTWRTASGIDLDHGVRTLVWLEHKPSDAESAPAPSRRWFRRERTDWREIRPEDDAELPFARLIAQRREPSELLAWRPGRRMTLAVAHPSGPAILKAFRPGRFERALAAHEQAWKSAGGTGFTVPAIYEHDREFATLVIERLPGARPTLGDEDIERFFRIGSALRAFQEHEPAAGLRTHGPDEEAQVLDRMAERVLACGLPLPERWLELRARLAGTRSHAPLARPALCHRDLHDGQLLVKGREIGLIDFDALCLADPALDAANLATHLHLRALQTLSKATPASALACSRALLEGLDREDEPAFAGRLRFYEASTFLRLALVYALRPPWSALPPTLVALADRCLRDLEHD